MTYVYLHRERVSRYHVLQLQKAVQKAYLIIITQKTKVVSSFLPKLLQSVDKLWVLTICEIQPFLVFQLDI